MIEAALEAQLAALATMSLAQLGNEWQRLTKAPLPRISESLLRMAIAYNLQVRKLGGLSREARRQLDPDKRSASRTSRAAPGTRLAREWQGTVHVVSIAEDGSVLWNDRHWRSLSEVARAITGTRWSGPAFFGLRARAAR